MEKLPSIIKLHAEQRARGDYDKVTVGGQTYGLTYAIVEDGKIVGGLVAFQQEPIIDRKLYFKIMQARNNTSKGKFILYMNEYDQPRYNPFIIN